MSISKSGRVQWLVVFWATLSFLGALRLLARGLAEGEALRWTSQLAGMNFSGVGLGGDSWFLIAKVLIGAILVYLGWRKPNGAIRYALAAWLGLNFLTTLLQPGGMSTSTGLLALLLDGIVFAAALWWAMRGALLETPPLGLGGKLLMAAGVALLAGQHFLIGAGQEETMIGVRQAAVTFGALLISLGLAPWGRMSPGDTIEDRVDEAA